MTKIIKALLLFSILALTICSAEAEDRQIKIGVLTDLSGPASYYGLQTQVGARLIEKDLQSEGKKVQIIFEDSVLSTQRGVTAANKLMLIDKVDALFVDFTPIAVAISPLSQKHKKLILYSAAARSVAATNPYAFKSYLDYEEGCEEVAKVFKRQGVKAVGLLKAQAEYGELCYQGIKKVYPEFEIREYVSGEMVASQILAFKSKGMEAIINASFEGDFTNMVRAAKNINYKPRFAAAEDTVTEKLQHEYGDMLEGCITFGLKKPPQSFIDTVKKTPGGDQLTGYYATSFMYVHIKQVVDALEQCPARDIDCQVSTLSRSQPEELIGFEGWENRIANLQTRIAEFSAGSFQEIKQ